MTRVNWLQSREPLRSGFGAKVARARGDDVSVPSFAERWGRREVLNPPRCHDCIAFPAKLGKKVFIGCPDFCELVHGCLVAWVRYCRSVRDPRLSNWDQEFLFKCANQSVRVGAGHGSSEWDADGIVDAAEVIGHLGSLHRVLELGIHLALLKEQVALICDDVVEAVVC